MNQGRERGCGWDRIAHMRAAVRSSRRDRRCRALLMPPHTRCRRAPASWLTLNRQRYRAVARRAYTRAAWRALASNESKRSVSHDSSGSKRIEPECDLRREIRRAQLDFRSHQGCPSWHVFDDEAMEAKPYRDPYPHHGMVPEIVRTIQSIAMGEV